MTSRGLGGDRTALAGLLESGGQLSGRGPVSIGSAIWAGGRCRLVGLICEATIGRCITSRDELNGWCEKHWPRFLGDVISTLSDSALYDQFPNTQCEEWCEIVIVGSATALPDGVSGTAGWLVEI